MIRGRVYTGLKSGKFPLRSFRDFRLEFIGFCPPFSISLFSIVPIKTLDCAPDNERVEGREEVFVDRAVHLEPPEAGLSVISRSMRITRTGSSRPARRIAAAGTE
jgi:hypothetical protein